MSYAIFGLNQETKLTRVQHLGSAAGTSWEQQIQMFPSCAFCWKHV